MKKITSLLLVSSCIMLLNQQIFAMDADARLRENAAAGNLMGVHNALYQGANVDSMSEDGYSALMEAARAGKKNVVQFLLDQGADVNLQKKLPGVAGYSALILAIMKYQPEIVKLLLDHGADKNATTNDGSPVALYALEYGNPKIQEYLKPEIQEYMAEIGIKAEDIL